jgi:hypothetical protein
MRINHAILGLAPPGTIASAREASRQRSIQRCPVCTSLATTDDLLEHCCSVRLNGAGNGKGAIGRTTHDDKLAGIGENAGDGCDIDLVSHQQQWLAGIACREPATQFCRLLLFTLVIPEKGVQDRQPGDSTEPEQLCRVMTSTPLARENLCICYAVLAETHTDATCLFTPGFREIPLRCAIADGKIGGVTDTRRGGMSQHGEMIAALQGLPEQ